MTTRALDTPPSPQSSKTPWGVILGLSAAITAFLVWWIYFKTTGVAEAAWIDALPAVNATFNTLAALCMVAGFVAIRRRRFETHKKLMLSGVGFSALFLVTYLVYHHFHGDTPFPGQGIVRPIYFAILISHVLLSIGMLPMILLTLYHSLGGRFAEHRKIARWTLPIWLYVSVTGVVIFFLLSVYVG